MCIGADGRGRLLVKGRGGFWVGGAYLVVGWLDKPCYEGWRAFWGTILEEPDLVASVVSWISFDFLS